ncbi:alpha-glucosidase [Zavarzinia sp. CC-PAN008]|uniref:alpha-glucosidase n=1 Tax=Zavarzinia sp. CC-PAN008 TaxID=3243332 RepID=UPI003F74A6F4
MPARNPRKTEPETPSAPDPALTWWRGAVIYQVYPWSFRDSNGDGIGDLAGVTAKLPYIASLNVDGVWLSPFFTSPMRDFGYDISDFCGVDPRFGTIRDFERLVARAHGLGLKVIIDQVYSHTSDRHPWFQESRGSRTNPKADWYVWADPRPDGSPPNNWLSMFGGMAWEWDTRRRQYYLHNFLREQPDLNLWNPEVEAAVFDVARFWLNHGIDGFRLDAANFYFHDRDLRSNPPRKVATPVKAVDLQEQIYNRSRPQTLDFLRRLRALMEQWPGTFAVAEIGSHEAVERMREYTSGPIHTAYSFIFLKDTFDAAHIRDVVEKLAGEDVWPSWSFGNHDVARVATRWGGAEPPAAFHALILALLVTLRGTLFLYQGEELGLPEARVPFGRLRDPDGIRNWPEWKGRDGCRTPMPWAAEARHAGFSDGEAQPWLPVEPRHRGLAVDQQERDPASTLSFARRLLAWRHSVPALVTGSIRFLDSVDGTLLIERTEGAQTVLAAFNLTDKAQTVTAAGSRRVLPPYGFLFLDPVGHRLFE